ncbi:sensor histidine kinase [Paenibacillus sp. 1001270B_150601_E10]|uniref:sensor histidine kinase n=1 Tax=Paenibacillus sp. 1001270B_150601_E10 TaxID=2787079 RepID=UPI00189CEF86|nr:ATP-binding protein [Paenibacillus sp. 1001270B_150601_E10]
MRKFTSLTFSTRNGLLILLFGISIILIIGFYMALTQSWSKQLIQYKQQYAKEQSYHLLYVLRERLKVHPDQEELLPIFKETAYHFSVPIRYLDEHRETILIDLLDHDWLTRSSLYTVEAPIIRDGQIDGYLTTYYDLDNANYSPALQQLEDQYERRSKQLLYLFISIAIALSVYTSWRLSRNLRAAARLAESIVIDNHWETIPVRGTAEAKVLITAINSLIQQFERHEAWRNQLMQDLTHELRTPLTAVLSHLDAIIDGIYPLTTNNIQRILVDIERLYRLVEDMEKLSEAEGAQFELNKQEVNLSRVVQSIYEGFLFLSREKGIYFDFIPSRTPCVIQADPDRIMQIVSNVMYNAIKYTPRGGQIEVGIVSQDESFSIYCKDTGIGIAEEELPRIFDRFYRTDKSRSRDSGGLGVGLSIAKALVEAHQGEIWAESTLGEGSIFWIRLPSQQLSLLEQPRHHLSAG